MVIPTPSKESRALSFWKIVRTYPVRSGLAICGLASLAAVVFRKKHGEQVKQEERVEDFTSEQQAMLQRVREIWDEYNAAGDQASERRRAASLG